MLPWLGRAPVFPPPESALDDPPGLLAAGGDLSVARLLAAYSHGIFPWYGPDEPILWWSPAPRMVLFPPQLKVSRSLAKTLRNTRYEIRVDTAFRQVMEACGAPRRGQRGTWILPEMVDAYCRLFDRGVAHSWETWIDGELVGGLYGVSLGTMFFGESMFSRQSDASKLAFVHMVRHLAAHGCGMIDCQMHTAHLASLGARLIPRDAFLATLKEQLARAQPINLWNYHYRNEPS
ncbi:MAG: leucyl/phenylalanyl-tRNA--protein transferase [Paludibacterium sp.]|uniref:leucyl/phenylalanyl-tRNA--protein transferase n=1 Tax=Paludibacterium sp. TaxID=1917523 RepID=UPI0025CC5144|nr:leucyl/phenylalanyl-tRNA--protein transferase [Paludibacterium sp.]MBV8049199.1 leucyl/phenylalanyl-tRNA--protein transferase [Paludibacterium sp.]MBV8647260.1 leucyl/phenylalanyl-tRNA--protein transferase [Paludibacterium sp.]